MSFIASTVHECTSITQTTYTDVRFDPFTWNASSPMVLRGLLARNLGKTKRCYIYIYTLDGPLQPLANAKVFRRYLQITFNT